MLCEVTVVVDARAAEALSDALLEEGALAVTVEDAQAGSADETALYGEPGSEPATEAWPSSRLQVLLEAGADPQQVLSAAAARCGIEAPMPTELCKVEDADWVRITQSQFPPVQAGRRLWIVPSWHAPPDPAALNIRIDPGAAFGTGTHPTTRLCLAWLEEHVQPGARVLDYGCGSGVLAIAAARLGAAAVHGVDIDAQALAAARDNSLANGVGPALARYTDPEQLPTETAAFRFDIVVANILANPLKLLAPALLARVGPGGGLVLAGLLDRQAQELIALYRSVDRQVELAPWRSLDGWTCLAGRRVNF